MKQILCVIDFSESSRRVLEVACKIANACGAHLIVLFPYRLIQNGYQGDITSLKANLESDARENFQKLKTKVSGVRDLSFEFQPEIGFISDRIDAYAKKNKIDMVIIGQQLSSSSDIITFNLENLISSSNLPFLIVPSVMTAKAGL